MGLVQEVRQIFQNLVNSDSLRNGVFPTSADTVAALAIVLTKNAAAWTWGAWAELAAAVAVTVPTQIVGFTLENFTGVVTQGEVQIGSGAGGAEVVLGVYPIVAAVYMLPKPIRVPAATRLAARYRNANATADTVDIKLITQTGF